MSRHLWIPLVLCACGKSAKTDDGKAGATTPEAAVRGVVEAVLAKDLERAKRFLPDDAACELAPVEHRQPCLENSRQMRAMIGEIADDIPDGTTIKAITKSDDLRPPSAELGAWTVAFADGEQAAMMTVKIGARYYAAFAVKRDSSPR